MFSRKETAMKGETAGQTAVRFDKDQRDDGNGREITGVNDVNAPGELRTRAIQHLKKRRDLAAHALVYTLVNGFIVIIWAVTSAGFFWPIFPMVGWGIGLVMNAWDVYRGDRFSEDSIQREIHRISAR
jgi:2TM domain